MARYRVAALPSPTVAVLRRFLPDRCCRGRGLSAPMVAEPTYRAKNTLFSGVRSSARQARATGGFAVSERQVGAATILVDEHSLRIVPVVL
jgi:hypothetical protein